MPYKGYDNRAFSDPIFLQVHFPLCAYTMQLYISAPPIFMFLSGLYSNGRKAKQPP